MFSASFRIRGLLAILAERLLSRRTCHHQHCARHYQEFRNLHLLQSHYLNQVNYVLMKQYKSTGCSDLLK